MSAKCHKRTLGRAPDGEEWFYSLRQARSAFSRSSDARVRVLAMGSPTSGQSATLPGGRDNSSDRERNRTQ